MKTLFKKHKELILYIFFGGVTTLVNLAVFKLCNLALGERWYLLSNIVAWVAAVAAAYISNKLWVFESKSWAAPVLAREIPSFVGARVFSLLVEEAGLWITVDLLGWGRWSLTLWGVTVGGKMICKILLAVIVVLLNYVFSKLVIFNKKNEGPVE